MRPIIDLVLALRALPVECVLVDLTNVRIVSTTRPGRTLLNVAVESDAKWSATWPDAPDRDAVADAAGIAEHVRVIIAADD